MTDAPKRIWVAPDTDDGWRWPVASKFPMQGYAPDGQTDYIRADLASPLGAEAECGHPFCGMKCGDGGPDHATLLAAALALPEVAALLEALRDIAAMRDYSLPSAADRAKSVLAAFDAKP